MKKCKLKKIKEYIARAKYKQKRGVKDKIKGILGYVSQILSEAIFQPIAEGAKRVMNNIEDSIMQIEKRMLRAVSSLLIIGLGGVFLILALFFFLKEFFGWSNAAAFFSIGITVFVTGILLKVRGYGK